MTSTSVTIPGYRITEQIYDGFRTRVYRAVCESSQQPIVIKLLKSEYPTFDELLQFRNQYTIGKNLDLTGIVKPLTLINHGNSYALVMEDIGGISLKEMMGRWGDAGAGTDPHSLTEFFNIAIQIVQTLEGLYHNRVIHKDIKPQNILINPETRQVKLIDFSISSLLPRENQEIINPNVLEGTLAYMSPEQTGRMNRGIDYRTDFYSLGVTFYELLTGQLPFTSSDPMELVYCHLAKIPIPPAELAPTIPQVVSDIVMKLMAKTAEERYQSAFGLRVDLETCLQQWQESGNISQFPLGRRDISERFVIPEKLYGRETEVVTLLAAFDRVAGRSAEKEPLNRQTSSHSSLPTPNSSLPTPNSSLPQSRSEMMLVTGFSGIGKTAVVNEVHKPIVRQRGYFIKGKFDQFKRDIPFSAWVQAFQNLMRQLLTESAEEVQKWKTLILEALGENGQVIIDIIPELELLIGKQPEVPQLEGSAAQNRFNLLFQKFIRLFAAKEHPLVIFLDDLQWADSASLKLMQLLMSETDTRYLLLIGAYRDNEVFPAHPLMLSLEEIRQTEAIVQQITLAPLEQSSLNCLIADTLNCPPERAVPLTELVFQKTKGNPFFSNRFLKSLYQDGLISFDFSCRYWQCDIAQVRALALTDDVVEFMALQLKKLPEKTQNVLKLAACIGNSFDLATLAIVYEKSQPETAADLWKALQEGLMIPTTEVYKFFQDAESAEVGQVSELSVRYKFLHDRVQQAAYFLISEDQKQSTHLKIGQLLLNNTPIEEREEKIFEIVNQLNRGVELITHSAEREELAQLNLIAGRKAKASTAYAAALRYLTEGIGLLRTDSWLQLYDLTLALHEEAAEAAYFIGDHQQAERLAEAVLQQAKTLLDKMKAYEVKIKAYQTQNKPLEAVQTGLSALALLGIEFPEKPSQLDIQHGMEEIRTNLAGKRIEDLIHLPPMTNPEKLAAMRIFSIVTPSLYSTNVELLSLVGFKQVNLSIKYGNALESASVYTNYGLILCGRVGDIDSGYQFGQLALSLLERLKAKEVKTKTVFYACVWTKHWKEHLRETLKHLLDAYSSGMETGDIQFAALSAYLYCNTSFFIGKELVGLRQEMANYGDVLAQLKQVATLEKHQIYQQAVITLIESAEENGNKKLIFSNPIEVNHKTASCQVYSTQLILCYLFNDYVKAVENAGNAEKYLSGVTSTMIVPIFHFYDSLARLAVYCNTPHSVSVSRRWAQQSEQAATKSQQTGILEKVAANQEKMQEWAHHAPMNHLHKFYLVEAERHRVLGQNVEAMDYYDRAIAGAKENEYIQEEALANELAAKFYLGWGKEKISQVYLTDAYYAYARWGAKAKVKDLEKRYPQLLAPILNRKKSQPTGDTLSRMTTETVTCSNTGGSAVLDLATVLKASQALSGEIHLDRLLSSLMQVVIESAGAEKCALILSKAGNLVIEATGVSGTAEATVLQSIPIEESQEIPVSLINYVYRTAESLVLDDASSENTFTADAYIIQQQPKSVLCTPLINQGQLIGILYLENNLTKSAFTPDRLELLKILASQAAISIENARLYSEVIERERKLRENEKRLTQFLEAVPVGVFIADANGTPYYANQTAQQILGKGIVTHTANQQLAEVYQAYQVGTQQRYPSERDALLRALKGESSSIDDMEIHQPEKVIPIEVWGTPIFNEQGEIAYAIVAFQDISVRKQAEQLIAEYSHTLEIQVQQRTTELEQEIVERKQTEEALRQSEAKNRAILAAIPDLMFQVSADGIYLGFMATNELISLLPPTYDPVGKHLSESLPPEVSQRHLQHLQQALATGKIQIYEQEVRIRDQLQYEEVRIVVSGENQALFMIRDISDRKRAEIALRQKNEELTNALQQLEATQEELIQSEKMAALGQLVAGIAHEINTPLGAIRSSIGNITDFLTNNLQQLPHFFQNLSLERQQDFLRLLEISSQQNMLLSSQEKRQIKKQLKRQLEEQTLDNTDSLASTLVNIGVWDDIQPFLSLLTAPDSEMVLKTAYEFASVQRSTRTITTATERAAKVVFALKSYARYDHSGEKIQANITEGIETVLTLYHNPIKYGVEVERNYEEVPLILCYPDELNQVWTNLVHNALQSMEYKGKLRIDVTQHESNMLVSITDSGKGISPEIMPKIFEPFFTTKPAGEGSGLGLNIVKKIVEKHQGKITVSSVPGETTFTVFLPIKLNDEKGK